MVGERLWYTARNGQSKPQLLEDTSVVLGFCLFLFAYGLGCFRADGRGRAPLRADRARNARSSRLGDAGSLRRGLAGEADPLLLAGHGLLQDFWSERLGRPRAFGRVRHAHGDGRLPVQLAHAARHAVRCRSDDSLLRARACHGARRFDRYAAGRPFRGWNALLVRVVRIRPAPVFACLSIF